jgi:Cu/Ag efflux protein CusF
MNMNKSNKLAAFLLAAAFAAPTFAQQQSARDHVAHHEAAPADGEVRKVDRDAKKITIKHGPIQNLDMPAMTMVFQVKDAAILDQVKAGDKVKFTAEKLGGVLTVTKIEKAK